MEPTKSMGPKNERQNGAEYIFQYDADLKLVAKYKTPREACVSTGIKNPTNISKAIRGVAHTAGGYFWSKGSRPLKKFPEKWVEISQTRKG